jgi:hypothetical protein
MWKSAYDPGEDAFLRLKFAHRNKEFKKTFLSHFPVHWEFVRSLGQVL